MRKFTVILLYLNSGHNETYHAHVEAENRNGAITSAIKECAEVSDEMLDEAAQDLLALAVFDGHLSESE